MILQACLNGARPASFHPRLPLTPNDVARDAVACLGAGAAELHLHPRAPDGRESLSAVDETLGLLRTVCPGTLIGVSTGAWIEGDAARTKAAIASWRVLPDYASVNLSEPDAPEIIALLLETGVGVEAGLATPADAERFVALPSCRRVLRVLVEIADQDPARADAAADSILAILAAAKAQRPVLLHGVEATTWHFVRRARRARMSARIGLEDGARRPDGGVASSNAELVSEAAWIFRSR